MEEKRYKTPGSLVIMLIYLVLFVIGYIVMFGLLGRGWPIS